MQQLYCFSHSLQKKVQLFKNSPFHSIFIFLLEKSRLQAWVSVCLLALWTRFKLKECLLCRCSQFQLSPELVWTSFRLLFTKQGICWILVHCSYVGFKLMVKLRRLLYQLGSGVWGDRHSVRACQLRNSYSGDAWLF